MKFTYKLCRKGWFNAGIYKSDGEVLYRIFCDNFCPSHHGEREVGELSVFDIVIYLVMSELLAISITDTHESILKSLVPIFTLAFLQIVISWVLLKSKKTRDIFDGKNAILIHNGHINQSIMKRERYNIDDLMSQIRSKDL